MKLILILLTGCFSFIQIDSKKYRLLPDDEVYPYDIVKSVPSFSEFFLIENLLFEQIDDEKVRTGGYGECIQSLDPKLPLVAALQTKNFEKSTWVDGPIRLASPDICSKFLDPSSFWFNITKLWTNCPPQKGDKWVVETQIINVEIEAPPSFASGAWRGYILFTQVLMGSTVKFGAMIQVELIEVL